MLKLKANSNPPYDFQTKSVLMLIIIQQLRLCMSESFPLGECAKFCGSHAIMGLVPLSHLGPKFFLLGTSWV